jgi:hypothetical protein
LHEFKVISSINLVILRILETNFELN